MPNANSSSIIQRLNHRALTGRALSITAHQHHGYRMHYVWNGAFGNRCFERRLPSYDSFSHFCVTLLNRTPEGLCSCIMVREGFHGYSGWVFGHVFELLYSKMEFSGRLLPGMAQCTDYRWPLLEVVKGFQEYGAG